MILIRSSQCDARLRAILFVVLVLSFAAVPNRSGLTQDRPQAKPGGGPPSAAERQNRSGPWDNDIIVYRSSKQADQAEQVARFERAGVATIALLEDGRLIAAHQYFPENNEADFDKVAVRFSTDEGRSWSEPEVIRLEGLPEGMRFPFDPTLVSLPDGRIRMYFTSLMGRRFDEATPAIYSAISENGVDFTCEEGMRFGVEGRNVIDCSVVLHQGRFHLFSPDNGAGMQPGGQGQDRRPDSDRARPGIGYHAISEDGLNFERKEDVEIGDDLKWLGCAQSDGETMTFFGTGAGGVWTAISADGASWNTGVVLRGIRVADPGVVVLDDGTRVVVGTGPPQPGQRQGGPGQGPQPRPRPPQR